MQVLVKKTKLSQVNMNFSTRDNKCGFLFLYSVTREELYDTNQKSSSYEEFVRFNSH